MYVVGGWGLCQWREDDEKRVATRAKSIVVTHEKEKIIFVALPLLRGDRRGGARGCPLSSV